ncbi:hypothetical protein [Niallia taxi]|nr:hypothetical protein [Niallia taxi]
MQSYYQAHPRILLSPGHYKYSQQFLKYHSTAVSQLYSINRTCIA